MLPARWPDWHGRQTVSGGARGVPPRARLAQEWCVELTRVLCSGLSGTLLTATLAKSSPYGRKQSKVLLTLQTWLRFKSHRETLETKVATGTQIRITETTTASFFNAGDRNRVQTWLSEGQLQVFGVHLSVNVPVGLLPLSSMCPWSSVAILVRRV